LNESREYGGEDMTSNYEINKALCMLFVEISVREKKKAIEIDDYGSALVAAMLEGIFREASLSFN
jgi:hypothetical protein